MFTITLTVNPALDKSFSVEKIVSTEKMNCSIPNFEAGGGGINVSRVLHRLGGKSKAIFQCSGPPGSYIQVALKNEGIDFETFPTKEWSRENVVVTEELSQKQYRFGMPGPAISESELQACVSLVKEHSSTAEYLVLSGSLPPTVPTEFYGLLCTWAKENEIKVILDTKGAALKEALKVGVYLVKPNLTELAEFVGEEDISEKRAEVIAKEMLENKQAELVVISLGENGAMMISSEGIQSLKSPTVKVISAVGAGDSMVAGLVYALQQKESINEVLKYGVVCGTAATLTPGSELCRKEDIQYIKGLLS